MIVQIKRVIYGKESTPKDLREYTIVGSGSSAVGTKKEIIKFFKDKGIDITMEEI